MQGGPSSAGYNPETMSRYVDGSYGAQHPTWHAEDSDWKAGQVMKMLRRHKLEPRRVCEVGSGAGGVLAALSEQLPAETIFDGYEIAPEAYRLAQARQKPNLSFHLGDLAAVETAGYDLALAIDVIEHVEDVFGFVRELRQKAERTVLHIPLDFTLVNLLRPNILINLRREVGHLHFFSKDTALALLADCGYTVEDWFYTPWAFELKSVTRKIALLNGPRRLGFGLRPDLAVRVFGGYSLMALAY